MRPVHGFIKKIQNIDRNQIKKAAFLRDADVVGFLAWLRQNLASLPVRAKAIPGAWTGPPQFGQAHQNYSWRGATWSRTLTSLNGFSVQLSAATKASNQGGAEKTCLDILQWGRVPRSGPDLRALAGAGKLTGYLSASRTTLALATADLALLGPIGYASSGWTKIYALASCDDLPIYDSRVAAAMAGLVALYLKSKSQTAVPPLLNFPVGNFRGDRLVRRPQDMPAAGGYPRFSRLVGSSPLRWASAQIRTGWILQELAAASLGEEVERRAPVWPGATMRDIEAGLFVIGYDLRSIL